MTFPANDFKFTDRDVRENPDLVTQAEHYLIRYGGDFDFLVRAKLAYQDSGVLPVATIRGVLNCMRSDPRELISSVVPIRKLHAVKLLRPAYVILKTTWNMNYITSTWPTAYLSHLLDKERSELRWMPHIEEYRFIPHTFCSANFGRVHLLMSHEVPDDKTECRRCREAKEENTPR